VVALDLGYNSITDAGAETLSRLLQVTDNTLIKKIRYCMKMQQKFYSRRKRYKRIGCFKQMPSFALNSPIYPNEKSMTPC
jgi:hypothetical protein